MLRTKKRLLGNLRSLRRSHQRYCNRMQLFISPFLPEFHLRSQHCSLETRENELRERIPVPHENYLKSISSSRPCCEGYFCLLFSWPSHVVYFHANVTCFATKHLKFDNRYSYKGAKGLSCWHVFDQRVSLTIPGLYGETRPKKRYLFQASGLWIKGGISLVEVYKTVGKSVIWVCGLKRLKDEFCGFKMPRKRSIFVLDSHLCIYSR